MATPQLFMEPTSPGQYDQPFVSDHDQDQLLDHSEEEGFEEPLPPLKPSNHNKLVSSQSGNNRDSGIQASMEINQSFTGGGSIDPNSGVRDPQSRTSSLGSGPHPYSSHASSEYSTDDNHDSGARGRYKISVEETQKRRKSGKLKTGMQ